MTSTSDLDPPAAADSLPMTRDWARLFGVSNRTIRNWREHPLVVSNVEKIKAERITELQAPVV